MTDSASVDMSRQLRAWHDDPLRQTSSIPSFAALARHLGIHSSVVRSWKVPPHELKHRNVRASRIYDLCQLMGIPEPTPGSTPDPAPDPVQKKRCAMPTCHEKVSPPKTQCLQHRREVARLDQQVAAMEPSKVPTRPYVGTCILCGRQDEYRWTVQEYQDAKPRRCTVCRGRMMVDPIPLTRIGSMDRAKLRVST